MIGRWLAAPLGILLLLGGIRAAIAQAGPPCGPDLPIKCTPGKDAAILLGFVGAGVLAFYLAYRMDHPKSKDAVVGCTAQAGETMIVTEDGTERIYELTHLGKQMRAGERVELWGDKRHDNSGRNVFKVRRLVRRGGTCTEQSPPETDSSLADSPQMFELR